MEQLKLKLKQWWNNPCFWSHDYEMKITEIKAVAYKCKKCNNIYLYRA